jgi:hypothetical protein
MGSSSTDLVPRDFPVAPDLVDLHGIGRGRAEMGMLLSIDIMVLLNVVCVDRGDNEIFRWNEW